MDFIRYRVMARYWMKHPPVHLLVAGYMNYKPPASAQLDTTQGTSPDNTVTLDIGTIMRLAPEGVMNINSLSA